MLQMDSHSRSSDWGAAREAPWVLILKQEERIVQEIVLAVASMSGMMLRTCTTAPEALEMLDEHTVPAVAVCDPNASGTGGIEVARRIRLLPYGAQTQIIFVAATITGPVADAIEALSPFAVIDLREEPEMLPVIIEGALENWAIMS